MSRRSNLLFLALFPAAVVACDGEDTTAPESSLQVAITLPADSARVEEGEDCILAATVTDPARLIDSLVWTSSRDGRLGESTSIVVRDLSPDWHEISVVAFDAVGRSGGAAIALRVETLPDPTITAPLDGQVFEFADAILFAGGATDRDGGEAILAWSSSIDGPLGTAALFFRDDLSPGPHTIWLSALDDDGQADSVSLAITVNEPRTGDLQVITTLKDSTDTSADLDPDGYLVVVDDTLARPAPINGWVVFAGLVAGEHRVELRDVADNCEVEESDRLIYVAAGGLTQTVFEVNCSTTFPVAIQNIVDEPGISSRPRSRWYFGEGFSDKRAFRAVESRNLSFSGSMR
ncbi:MAG: hypothetical protein JSU87_14160 [Gemmatimonadota bacterium]|nr:MAG: hypothetical protein JSU87_14160 [Gemmatimonadota bacterium]